MQVVRDNLARIRDRIAKAADRAGRKTRDITLVGVSKYVESKQAAELVQAGCHDLGESRPQQLWDKAASTSLQQANVRWHMIGHLQRNKVARTLPVATLLHSVDSRRLLAAIDKAAASIDKRQAVLLEVNCSGDDAKHGFTADGLREILQQLTEFPSVEVRGLMTMASGDRSTATAAVNFAGLRQLREQVSSELPDGVELTELSMGMSGDFEVAIAEGATMVRVGSALWDGVD